MHTFPIQTQHAPVLLCLRCWLGIGAALLDGVCQLLQNGHGLRHADAGIGNGYAMRQCAFAKVLAAFLQVAFDHDAGDALLASGDLAGKTVGGAGTL